MTLDHSTHRAPHLFERHTIPASGAIGLASLGLHLILPDTLSNLLAAFLIPLIAGIYIGFAVVDGRMSRIIVESTVAFMFLGFAIWSYLHAPYLIPLGYVAHAGWDFLHHTPLFNVAMPRWYIPACVVYDVLVAVGLWVIWAI